MKFDLVILILLAASSTCIPTLVIAEEPEHHKVIVIGAGISGLGAADQLKKLGYSDVVILEARDRAGGRLFTDRTNYPLDMGASWIHGIENNPIVELAENYRLNFTSFTDDPDDSLIIYDSDGKPITEERYTKIMDSESDELITLSDELVGSFDAEREKLASGEDISYEEILDKFIQNRKDLDSEDIKDLHFKMSMMFEVEDGELPSKISLYSWQFMGYKMEGDAVIFPDGYDQITNKLKTGLDIRYNQFVREIDYNNNIIHLKTADNKEYTANYIISTIPLGVLQNKSSVKFSPDLPENKNNAINNLGMGFLHKVYFVFSEPFWDNHYSWIGYIPENRSQWAVFANLYNATGKPVLLAFHGGDFARELEKRYLSGENVATEGLSILKIIYGNNVTNLEYSKVSTWGVEAPSLGSYSYLKEGSTNADYYTISLPVKNKVFFAGEATEVRYPATVHGAYLSGVREALRVQAVDKQYLPMQQIDKGLLPEYVLCKEGLEVALFAPDAKESICVKSSTKAELIKRGWNLCPESIEEILSSKDPASLSCKTSLLTYEDYWKAEENGDGYKTNE